MYWISVLSSIALVLPARCWTSGCSCEWLCSLGAPGCLAASMLMAGVLFATLSLFWEFRSIERLH